MMRPLVMLAVFAAATGCGGEAGPPVVAANVVVTGPAAQAPMAAAYLDISNRSGAPVRITHVSSPEYESVEIHETVVEDDIARMRRIPALEIENGETVVFERGGKHLMLMKPVGTPGSITLNFYSDDVLLLSVGTEFTAAMD
jgi:copper(I)-binding protein